MDMTRLQGVLISLTKRNISQAEIAKALNITPQTVSKRVRTKSELTPIEVDKINVHFKVGLLTTGNVEDFNKDELIKQIKQSFDIPDTDIEFVKSVLTAQPERSLHLIFKKALLGDTDAVELCRSLLNNPSLTKELFFKDEGVIK